jgi:acylphosphatase
MIRRARAIVSGYVQGVAYRASTAAEARRLGLVGWVKNCVDGTVQLEVEGEDDCVAALLAWCEQGPPAARVANVMVEELAPRGREREFAITR